METCKAARGWEKEPVKSAHVNEGGLRRKGEPAMCLEAQAAHLTDKTRSCEKLEGREEDGRSSM